MELSRLFSGTIAGFVATAPMSLAMKGMQALLPEKESYSLPPSIISFNAANKSGQPPSNEKEHTVLTLLAHFGAGAGFGLFYGLGSVGSKKLKSNPLRGIVFGLLVWSVNYLGIMPVLNLYNSASKEPVRRNALMIIAHLVWGITTDLVFRRLDSVRKRLV
jgi:putative membrane protein